MSDADAPRLKALSAIRHDLRTPLSVILGLSQILQSEVTDAAQREDLAHIINNAQKLETLIDDFVGLVHEWLEGTDPS